MWAKRLGGDQGETSWGETSCYHSHSTIVSSIVDLELLENPGRFGPGSFRPGSFRPNLGVGRFGLGRWVDSAMGRFGPGSFRP